MPYQPKYPHVPKGPQNISGKSQIEPPSHKTEISAMEYYHIAAMAAEELYGPLIAEVRGEPESKGTKNLAGILKGLADKSPNGATIDINDLAKRLHVF